MLVISMSVGAVYLLRRSLAECSSELDGLVIAVGGLFLHLATDQGATAQQGGDQGGLERAVLAHPGAPPRDRRTPVAPRSARAGLPRPQF